MKLYLNSRKGSHSAIAEYSAKGVKVLKGSKINMELLYPKMPPQIVKLRNDRKIVSADGVLLTDTMFETPTSAAHFVTGRSVNGYVAWRVENKISLKQYLEQNK